MMVKPKHTHALGGHLLGWTLKAAVLAYLALGGVAHGQFIQDWTWQTANGQETPYWRPAVGDALREVLTLAPASVFLKYNCYYMTAICQNANEYLTSARGKGRRWRSAFSFDFVTARKNRRRGSSAVCGNG